MVVQITTLIWFLLCCITNGISAQLEAAKPGCSFNCGAVGIPYPFGLTTDRSDCYADDYFAIDCRTDRTADAGSRAFLNKLNIEVLDIDFIVGTLQIMNPITYWNCDSNSTNTPRMTLVGSPFSFSSKDNRFVAVGCNTLSTLYYNGSYICGCTSICVGAEEPFSSFRDSNCNGTGCCQTSLPPDGVFLEYNLTVQSVKDDKGKNNCTFAAIVSNDLLTNETTTPDSETENEVSAVLQWSLKKSQLPADCLGIRMQNRTDTEYLYNCDCPIFHDNMYIEGFCRDALYKLTYAANKRGRTKATVIGVSSGLGFLLLVLIAYCLLKVLKRRRMKIRREKFFKQNGGLILQERFSSPGEVNVDNSKLFSSKELENATNQFNVNRILGKGGQGTVYKGMLPDGRIVAVKKFKVQGNVEEFINEVIILSQVNHRNVVKLLGFCLETEVPLLVYEFIPNGTLYEHLHKQSEEMPLTWDMRIRIANEVAGALSYLHSAASRPIYHRDIKSSNILLDEVFKAKMADFGASRTISIDQTHLTTNVLGTIGYLDPLYCHSSQYTEKSDVYSFGVVLVELLTGLKPISSSTKQDEVRNLAAHFNEVKAQGHLYDIIDDGVLREADKEQIAGVANLAYRCLELDGKKRPTMKQVTIALEGMINLHKDFDTQDEDHQEVINCIEVGDYGADPYATFTSLESSMSDTSVLTS